MGQLVGAFATAHSPGLTGFPEREDAVKRAAIVAAFDDVRSRIAALRPDAIVAVSVEHFTNFSLANLPAFAIATAPSYLGPVTEQMGEFLGISQRRYPGADGLGEHLYRYAIEAEFDPSLIAGDLDFDENFCVPLAFVDPDSRIPLVPIIVNGVNHPGPTARRCYAFGRMLRAAIEAQDGAERVVVLGTGGLSHWVGMRESGTINERFDREFLRRIGSDDESELVAYRQDDIDEAGNGADEIRAWIVAAGAAGVGFDTLAYEPTPAWLTGTAVAAARL